MRQAWLIPRCPSCWRTFQKDTATTPRHWVMHEGEWQPCPAAGQLVAFNAKYDAKPVFWRDGTTMGDDRPTCCGVTKAGRPCQLPGAYSNLCGAHYKTTMRSKTVAGRPEAGLSAFQGEA